MIRRTMPELTSRAALGRVAALLLIATIIIVVDVRVPSVDIVPDAAGGVLVLVAVMRLRSAVRGADRELAWLLVLAVISLAVSVLETFAPLTDVPAIVAISQPLGALVLAGLVRRLLAEPEPALAATWRTTEQLILWLGIVPLAVSVLIGSAAGGVQVQTPLAIIVVILLAVPLVALLIALWRTARGPEAAVPS
jgi:hypothetical protein